MVYTGIKRMKHLKSFKLFEKLEINEISEILKRDCSEFLKLLKQSGQGPIFRGFEDMYSEFDEFQSHTERHPRDMSIEVHRTLDELFENKFGIKVRSRGNFCTFDIETAKRYGKPFMFFPIGEFKYFWNPKVLDLYTEIDNEGYNYIWDWDAELAEEMWLDRYGEDTGNGTYRYLTIDTGKNNYRDAKKEVEENPEEYALLGGGFENFKLVWEPEKTLQQFEQDYVRDWETEKQNFLRDLVNGYITTNIEKAKLHEVAIISDKFYLVSTDLVSVDSFIDKVLTDN